MSLNSYTVQPGSPRALVPRLRLKLELLSSVNGLVAQPRRKLEYGRVKMKGGGGAWCLQGKRSGGGGGGGVLSTFNPHVKSIGCRA